MTAALKTTPRPPEYALKTRLARLDDADAIISLRCAYFQSQKAAGLLDLPLDPTEMVKQTTPRLLENPRVAMQLAVDDRERVLGYAYGQVRIVPGQTRPSVGSIEEFFIEEGLRGAGISEELFDAARADLQRRGAQRLQLRVLANNETARRFWHRLGFRENVAIYEYAPTPPAEERRDAAG